MQVAKSARTTVVSTHGKPSVRDNLLAVFGTKVVAALEPVEAEQDGFGIKGFVSSAIKTGSKTNGDRQFFCLNGRPVELPKALRVVNDVYRCMPMPLPLRSLNPRVACAGALTWNAAVCRSLSSPATAGCKAMFMLNVTTERSDVDVNVTPDKRTVMLTREAALLAALRLVLEGVWDASKWQFSQSLATAASAGATDGCALLSF